MAHQVIDVVTPYIAAPGAVNPDLLAAATKNAASLVDNIFSELALPSQVRAEVAAQITSNPVIVATATQVLTDLLGSAAPAEVVAAIADTKWVRPSLTAASPPIDAMRLPADAGTYPVRTVADATALGLPVAQPGFLTVVHVTGTSVSSSTAVQTYQQSDTGALWQRVTVTNGWRGWISVAGDPYYAATLPDGADLSSLRNPHNTVYTLSGSATYLSAPPWATTGRQAGMLIVEATGQGDAWQRVVLRGGTGSWQRQATSSTTWGPWQQTATPALTRRLGTLTNGTDLDALTSTDDLGIFVLGSGSTYPNMPPRPTPETGMLVNLVDGSGDAWQRVVWREGQGVWERERENTSGRWTPWRDVSQHALARIAGRIEALEAAATAAGIPTTVWENTGAWTSFWAGEAYLDRVGALPGVRLLDVGTSYEGRMIRAARLGDPTKPTVVVMYAQHGSERAQREGVFLWLRQVALDHPAWLDDLCLLVIPTVNVDRALLVRENARGRDLNRDWAEKVSREVRALDALYQGYDIVALIDGHEHDRDTADALLGVPSNAAADPALIAGSQTLRTAMQAAIRAQGYGASDWLDQTGDAGTACNAAALQYRALGILIETPGGGPSVQPAATRVAMHQAALDGALAHVQANLAGILAARP